MLIDGLVIGGYRSFGDRQTIGPFAKINVFAGKNNSGKSNILRFLTHHFADLINAHKKRERVAGHFSDLDRHRGGSDSFVFGVARGVEDARYRSLSEQVSRTNEGGLLERLLRCTTLSRDTNYIWVELEAKTQRGALTRPDVLVQRVREELDFTEYAWKSLWNRLRPDRTGGAVEHWIGEILDVLDPFKNEAPRVDLIPAVRRIGDKGSEPNDFSGIGIIDRLAQLQNPSHADQDKKRSFGRINEFLRQVSGNQSASLDIPYERDMILVHMDGKTLPLDSLGTGIHEVIILAAAATVLHEQVICIEEPELHLHPMLQRELIGYLQKNTDNQYFITTHSSHFLDLPDVTVFHVRLENGQTIVTSARSAPEKYNICSDLGYRASDLLQANSVIWVEGPSDRVYLNHWIHEVDTDLVEGVHYSIMFYGGRLLRHLSARDPEVEEFISLRRLNRNLVIVMDSDRSSARGRLNDTKTRVRHEFDEGDGFAWITKGREIENYIPPDVLQAAIASVHPGLGKKVSLGRFDHAIPVDRRTGKALHVDKVKVAHEVAKQAPDLSVLELKKDICRLVDFVHKANEG